MDKIRVQKKVGQSKNDLRMKQQEMMKVMQDARTPVSTTNRTIASKFTSLRNWIENDDDA